MKKNTHPYYDKILVKCSCGNIFNIKSAVNIDINIETCNKCNSFYIKKNENFNKKEGRISKFNKNLKKTIL